MSKHRRLTFVMCIPIAACGVTYAQMQFEWTNGSGDHQWGTPMNWDPAGPPGALDTAVIQSGAPFCESLLQAQVFKILADGPLQVNNGTFVTQSGGTLGDFFGKFPATLTSHGPLEFTGQAGTNLILFNGAGPYLVSGAFAMNGLTLDSTMVNAGSVLLTGGSLEIKAGRTLTNNGTMQIQASGVQVKGAGTLVNASDLLYSSGAAGFISGPLVFRQSSGSTSSLLGSLGIDRSEWLGGTIDVGSLGAVQLLPFGTGQADFDGLTAVQGAGTLICTAASNQPPPVRVLKDVEFNLTGGAGFDWQGGNIEILARLKNKGLFTIKTSSGLEGPGELVNETGATLVAQQGLPLKSGMILQNKGLLTVAAGKPITLTTGGTLVNESGGTVSMLAGAFAQDGGNGGRINNRGTITFAEGQHLIGVTYDHGNGGLTSVASEGSTFIQTGGEWSGAASKFEIGRSGLFAISSVANVLVTEGVHDIIGSGGSAMLNSATASLIADGGAVRIDCDVATNPLQHGSFAFTQGVMGGPGTIQNFGIFEWKGGTIGSSGVANVENVHDMDVTGGTLAGKLTNLFGARLDGWPQTITSTGLLVNQGEWTLGGSGVLSISGTGTISNSNKMTILPGNFQININCRLENTGSVTIVGPSKLNLKSATLPQFVNGELMGGQWEVLPDAELILPEGITTLSQGSSLRCSGTTCPDVESLSLITEGSEFGCDDDTLLDGALICDDGGGCSINIGATLEIPGSCTLEEPPQPMSVLAYCDTRPVVGDRPPAPARLVTPSLNNHGVVRPGGQEGIGLMELVGDLVQFETGRLEFDIGGVLPGQSHDQINVDGSVSLDGTLRLAFLPGYEPMLGEMFTLLTASWMSGMIDKIETPTHPGGLTLDVVIAQTGIIAQVVAGCYPDCDHSSTLDLFDFLCFVNAFNGAQPYADCDLSGSHDLFDFLCFVNAFNAGCQ